MITPIDQKPSSSPCRLVLGNILSVYTSTLIWGVTLVSIWVATSLSSSYRRLGFKLYRCWRTSQSARADRGLEFQVLRRREDGSSSARRQMRRKRRIAHTECWRPCPNANVRTHIMAPVIRQKVKHAHKHGGRVSPPEVNAWIITRRRQTPPILTKQMDKNVHDEEEDEEEERKVGTQWRANSSWSLDEAYYRGASYRLKAHLH